MISNDKAAFRNNERRKSLDYAKGIGILLLILSHCISDLNNLKIWIFSFHMPIFFVVCGMIQQEKLSLGRRKSKSEFIKNRAFQLGVPYFVFGFVLILFFQLLNILGGKPLTVFSMLFSLFSFQGIESMWFLPVYFFGELIFVYWFYDLNDKNKIMSFIISIAFVVCASFYGFPSFWLFRSLFRILIGFVFICFGYFIGKYRIIQNVSIKSGILGIIIFSFLAIFNGFVGIGSLELQNVFLFFINGMALSFLIIWVCLQLEKNCFNLNVLNEFGKNTIVIVCTNNLFIEIIRLLDYKLTGNFLLNTGMFGSVLFFVILSFLEYLVIKVTKGKLSFLFGRR